MEETHVRFLFREPEQYAGQEVIVRRRISKNGKSARTLRVPRTSRREDGAEAAQDGARPRRSRPPVRAAPRPRRIDVTMTTTKRASSDGAEAVRGDIGGIAPFLPEPGRPGRSGGASAGTVRRRFTGCSKVSIQKRGVT